MKVALGESAVQHYRGTLKLLFIYFLCGLNRNTAEVFPMIASNLASFPTLLENIAWIRNFSLADGQLVSIPLRTVLKRVFLSCKVT